jgi:NADPH:quinone reductase-like Zn-dependent oxidoreductase
LPATADERKKTVKAVLIQRYGGPEVLEIADVAKPTPGPGDVLIRVAYASINPADYKFRDGVLKDIVLQPLPVVPGMDCSGTVEAVGSSVHGINPGDRVVALAITGMGYQGAYAEYLSVPAQRVFPLPQGLSLAEGATVPIAGACAANAVLAVAPAKAGQQALVNGGAGSVGTFAIQLLRCLGARVAATCSTRNVEHVRSLGAELVIDYTADSLAEKLAEWAPEGLDSAYDAISGGSLPRDMPGLIRPGGTLVCILTQVTGVEAFDLDLAAKREVHVIDDFSTSMTEDHTLYQVAPLRTLLEFIGDGKIVPPPHEILPLESVAEAQARVATGHVRGKILLDLTQ